MTTMEMFAAWGRGREARARKPRRTPVLMRMATWAGRTLPTWKRARTATMQVSAFALIDWALFEWALIPGLIGAGVALLVLEALGGER